MTNLGVEDVPKIFYLAVNEAADANILQEKREEFDKEALERIRQMEEFGTDFWEQIEMERKYFGERAACGCLDELINVQNELLEMKKMWLL